MAKPAARLRNEMPWKDADPSRKIGINIPMPEPLMKQLDYLIENKAIRSKSSFIRDSVAKAATEETERLWKVREAVRRMEDEEKTSRRSK
jgi:Arc/MetJ-type ribon-helix-helix transcriptional regulator